MDKGLIHIYTGSGKGKTTAAVGLCLRCAMQGFKVGFTSFMKDFESGELKGEAAFTVFRHKPFKGFWCDMSEDERKAASAAANEALKDIFLIAENECYDLIALDEVLVAAVSGCIDTQLLKELLQNKPSTLEVVMTGCTCPNAIMELADYVSEIKALRHPYKKGVCARKGIEY